MNIVHLHRSTLFPPVVTERVDTYDSIGILLSYDKWRQPERSLLCATSAVLIVPATELRKGLNYSKASHIGATVRVSTGPMPPPTNHVQE